MTMDWGEDGLLIERYNVDAHYITLVENKCRCKCKMQIKVQYDDHSTAVSLKVHERIRYPPPFIKYNMQVHTYGSTYMMYLPYPPISTGRKFGGLGVRAIFGPTYMLGTYILPTYKVVIAVYCTSTHVYIDVHYIPI